jgi:hypothetical protein
MSKDSSGSRLGGGAGVDARAYSIATPAISMSQPEFRIALRAISVLSLNVCNDRLVLSRYATHRPTILGWVARCSKNRVSRSSSI